MHACLLIVEDEPRLARAVRSILVAEGFHICLCAGVAEAVEAINKGPVVAAILDINVSDGLVYPLADRLQGEGVPYAFCSWVLPGSLPSRHQAVPFLQKPIEVDQLLELANGLVAGSSAWHG